MQLIKKITATAMGIFASALLMAQTPSSTNVKVDADTMLVVCISLLGIVILFLGNTLLFSMKSYGEKKRQERLNESIIKTVAFIGFLMIGFSSMAQTSNTATEAVSNSQPTSAFRILLYTIIGLEMLIIVVFAQLIKFFINPEVLFVVKEERKPIFKITFNFNKWWGKINQFKPLDHEASIDTGHSYDGIHELDNVTPPWFKVAFILSIIIAFGYLYRFQVAKSAPSQIEEYNIEVAEAKVQQEEYLASQKNNVDENTVVMLDNDGVSSGAVLYKINCVACHGALGQGGVGPNLTDDRWIHQGGIKDIFKTLKYGWIEKGMKSWKDDFSPVQMAQLASFVKTLKGTNPPGAKEPQGDVFVEVVADTTAKKVMPNSNGTK